MVGLLLPSKRLAGVKRVTEAWLDFGGKGFEEEVRYYEGTRKLYDSPGFKALPVAVQKEMKDFLAIELTPPRRFDPSVWIQYKKKAPIGRLRRSRCGGITIYKRSFIRMLPQRVGFMGCGSLIISVTDRVRARILGYWVLTAR